LKDETIYLHSGRLLFEIQERETLTTRKMFPGEGVHITPKTIHRMTTLEDGDILEVSTPELTTSCESKTDTAGKIGRSETRRLV
jgi:hypothetical protein